MEVVPQSDGPDRLAWAVAWGRRVGTFMSVQVAVQGLSFLGGIIIVRTLSKADYALYTLANTMQGTMAVLADVGISSGLSAIGGRVWNDRHRFGQLIHTALELRRRLLVLSAAVVLPILIWLLMRHGAGRGDAFLIAGIVLIGLAGQVEVAIHIVVPRMHLQVGRVQKLDFVAAAVRLGLLAVAYFTLLNTVSALAAVLGSLAIQAWVLRGWSRREIEADAGSNAEYRTGIWAIVRKQAGNDIYFCLSSQIAIWLIGLFGSTRNVADLGALGRLGAVFTVLSATMSAVILPRFARIRSPAMLPKRYLQIVGACAAFGATLFFAGLLVPGPFLFILGAKYFHLRAELALVFGAAALNGISAAMWTTNCSRGWILPPAVNITVGIATQTLLIWWLDISTLRGVLWMGLLSVLPGIAMNAWVAWREMRRESALASVGAC